MSGTQQRLIRTRPIDSDYIESILRACSDYSISLVNGDDLVGSATLVTIKGHHGFLTADHVWDVFVRRPASNHFCIVATTGIRHRFEYRFEDCSRFVVGQYSSNHEETGPDLVFVRLNDQLRNSTLKSLRSFYPIERDRLDTFNAIPIENCPVLLWGAPYERTEKTSLQDGTPLLQIKHWAGVGKFLGRFSHSGFDYLKVQFDAGGSGYPSEYNGVSGGGLWVSYQTSSDEGGALLHTPRLLLIGVAFYQKPDGPTSKQIIAHGPDSIYRSAASCVI